MQWSWCEWCVKCLRRRTHGDRVRTASFSILNLLITRSNVHDLDPTLTLQVDQTTRRGRQHHRVCDDVRVVVQRHQPDASVSELYPLQQLCRVSAARSLLRARHNRVVPAPVTVRIVRTTDAAVLVGPRLLSQWCMRV
jgi:hypothetical protein